MKSKKFTYVLMACVAAVWGIIFYRIFVAVSEEDAPIMAGTVTKTAYFKMVNHEEDPVSLNLDYRNPFSSSTAGFVEEKTVSAVRVNVASPQPPFMPKPQVNWSGVSYSGYINNPSTKQKLAILSVNGKEVMLSEGQSANGIKLLKHTGDSVKVQYQGETKYIRIK